MVQVPKLINVERYVSFYSYRMATGYTYVDYTTKERKEDEDEDDKKSITYDKKEEAEKSNDDGE